MRNSENPHNVTAEQIGLENVNNTADIDKPISNAVQEALNEKANSEHTHGDATTSTSGLMSAEDKTKLDSLGNTISLLDVYPVGAIYISTVHTSPATLFGGTWEQINDTFLLASGSTYAAGSTGGEAKHTLTISEMPSHNHRYDAMSFSIEEGDDTTWVTARNYLDVGLSMGYPSTSYTGGGNAHNNMPPYLTVYMWKRTA